MPSNVPVLTTNGLVALLPVRGVTLASYLSAGRSGRTSTGSSVGSGVSAGAGVGVGSGSTAVGVQLTAVKINISVTISASDPLKALIFIIFSSLKHFYNYNMKLYILQVIILSVNIFINIYYFNRESAMIQE